MVIKIKDGVVHQLSDDLKRIILRDLKIYKIWQDITPFARNEWICWIESAKKLDTRSRRIKIMFDKMKSGERRPCCWAGCPHR